ncbi:MAG: nitroreductase family protein [Bacteroidales bacterium]|nr:nitroreductase family protein [Bacteroidales bacterium]
MIHPLISKRRSPVLFSGRSISREDLIDIFEAARWAPSSNNQQPWRYIIATRETPDEHSGLLSCLSEGNILWAKFAPVLGISIAESISTYKNRKNRFARHDVGLSMAFLIIQAMSSGIYTHVMGGFDPELAIESLSIPERFEPVAMFALGYPAENVMEFPRDLIDREKKERSRKNISEILYYGKWQRSYNI